MWSPEINDFTHKDQKVHAEYRTDLDHIQVVQTDTDRFLLRSSSRQYDSSTDLFTPWADWETDYENFPFPNIMYVFSSLVLEKSAVDEYRWSEAMRG